MINLKMSFYRKTGLAILSLMIQKSILACGIHSLGGGELFDREFKEHTTQQIAQGAMFLQEQDSEHFTKGYRPQNMTSMSGTYCQEVYDFEPTKSAHELFYSIRKSQLEAGYEVGFECNGNDCGDIDGWKLFLSNSVAGASESQKFLTTYFGSKDFYVVANMIHINEFDSRPRVTVTSIYRPEALSLNLINKGNSLVSKKANSDLFDLHEIGTLYFKSNEANEFDSQVFENIIERMKGDHPESKYLVIGYADTAGDLNSNQRLSLSRAESVSDKLLSVLDIERSRFHSIGKGEIPGFSKARKVSIFRVPSQ